MKQLFLFFAVIWVFTAQSQNLTQNSNLSAGWAGWDASGCTPEIGGPYGYTGAPFWFESTYGGPSSTNLVAQLGGGKCLQQILCVLKGVTYQIKFKGTRRCESDNPDLPPTLSIVVRAMGTTSFTMYSEVIYNYSNTTWNWYDETQTFTIPAGASDDKVYFSITGYNITTEFGAVVDDVTVTPVQTIAVNGPAVAAPNTSTNWSIDNTPVSGVSYNWSFPGATPSSSTLANPTNIQWASPGTKTVSCILGNGNCDMATVNQNINVTAPLPAAMIAFSATEKAGGVDLAWTTINEINSDYFAVYKSKDGASFTEMGRVKSAGVAAGSSYRYNDPAPGNGLVYYRLRQVDKNGNYKVSDIVKVKLGVSDLDMTVYPTIVTSTVSYALETPHAQKMKVLVTDMSGRVLTAVAESFSAGTNKKAVDVSTFAPGVYMLTVMDGNTGFKKTVPFTKN